jgi:hypothetical protein
MRKYLVAIFSIISITPAMANDVDLSKGRVSHEYGRTKQALSLKNNTARPLNEVWAECGFFRGDELVRKGIASFRNVLPGQTAHDEATSASRDVTRTDATLKIRTSDAELQAPPSRRYPAHAVTTAGASLFDQPMPHYFGGGETVTSIAE